MSCRFLSKIARIPKIGFSKRQLSSIAKEGDEILSQSESESNFKKIPIIEKIHNLTQESIDAGRPHFQVGGKRLYFPSARVVLLRPNAKHTPYQAKFIVPKSFNKLDLRDYLFHIYGLRATNITTQLLHGKYQRSLPMPYRARHRAPQIKKMTINMLEPFIWPQDESIKLLENEKKLAEETMQYFNDHTRVGSDKLKPSTAFGGIIDPELPAENFVSKKINRVMKNKKIRAKDDYNKIEQEERLKNFLNL
ncbi:hypothetical protein PACTADRAFT_47162 [Pachysolen tannophilus NRRL Y-2460]|uniref:Large ribosomal subunit protein uL23m n=1 Tax=Pachysolen tannophilus NRRL Y-2460 TaxID=669874 RepID=A0A1E4TMX2_PACTA|nr:hypothetical protein PACTADRAFT_47162 [Pachysolen tannophilus NRRL Y-2460]